MNSYLLNAISAVGGAILVNVGKLSDFFGDRRKHREALREKYFDKKLEIYLSAVSVYTTLSGVLLNTETQMKLFVNFGFAESSDSATIVLENLGAVNSTYLKSVEQAQLVYSVGLFLDIDSSFDEVSQATFDFHNELSKLDQRLADFSNVASKFGIRNKEQFDSLPDGHECRVQFAEFQSFINRLIEKIVRFRTEIVMLVEKLRSDMSASV